MQWAVDSVRVTVSASPPDKILDASAPAKPSGCISVFEDPTYYKDDIALVSLL